MRLKLNYDLEESFGSWKMRTDEVVMPIVGLNAKLLLKKDTPHIWSPPFLQNNIQPI